MKTIDRRLVAPMIIAVALTSGCNRGGETQKPATQVAAKVNSTEITVSQVNNVLNRMPNVAPENSERVKREILDKLIDAELAKEEAVAKKLDRSPAVVQQIEAAKTELLARAYVEQFASQQPKPTAEEIKKYYADHPEFFTQRRVFNVEEIAMPGKPGLPEKLRDQIAKTRSMAAIAAWLKSEGVQFNANSGVRFSEQIPGEYQKQIQTMKDGEIRLIQNGPALLVVHVVASKAAPVDEAQAAPRIQQYLFAERSKVALSADMKQLKEKAKIEYIGEFAASAAEAQAKAKATAEAKANAKAEAKAKAAAEAEARADQLAKSRREAEAASKAEAEARAKDEEAARARRAAEAKAREAESLKAERSKSAKPLTPELEKGMRDILR